MYFSRIRVKPEIFKNTQLTKVLADNSYNLHRLLWDLFPEEKKRCFIYREEIAREQLGGRSGARGEPIYYLVSSCKPAKEKQNPIFAIESKEYSPKLQQGDKLRFELRANPVVTKCGKKHDVVMNTQRTFLIELCNELNLMQYLTSSPEKGELKKVLLDHGGQSLELRLTTFLENDYRYAERLRQKMTTGEKLEWSLKAAIDTALDKWLSNQGARHGFELAINQDGQLKLQNSTYHWHELPKKAIKGKKSGFSSVDFVGELHVVDTQKFSQALFEGVGRSKAFGCGLVLVKRI
ncbi:MAG: type I-E CRISPR-associated protein Cas6/Cse3/CasE [Desulfobulbaceae bacterium]|nr:type I-E CRISPR-associated protein Cas6/Cse3/CasE [Desulfobulbaceae bacterium]